MHALLPTCNDLHSGYPILLSLVRQHGAMDDVTDGIDVGHCGTEVAVHLRQGTRHHNRA